MRGAYDGKKVLFLDASEILTILKRTGSKSHPLQGLNALVNRGDKFFSSTMILSKSWKALKNGTVKKEKLIQQWLKDNAIRLVAVDRVREEVSHSD
ncbi:hypothetical protein QW131_15440 [Roseibium salinum]|nr:hypothetical protein [Roseibium salinum]